MDKFKLQPDPCDNRLVRCQNCVQACGCLVSCVGCIVSCLPVPGADEAGKAVVCTGRIVSCVADVCFYVLITCMSAQTKHELWTQERGSAPQGGNKAPANMAMQREVKVEMKGTSAQPAPGSSAA